MITSPKIKRLVLALLLIFAILPKDSFSQCNTNTSICTSGTAGPFNFLPSSGHVSTCLDFINGNNAPNYAFILLYITQSGPLGMLIDANTNGGFLDVAVFNIPNGVSPCVAIQSTSNQIGCNYAASAGGCNQFGTYFGCNSSVPSPYVNAGQVIMIVVEDWSNVQTNITLQLAPPPSAQTGPPNAFIYPAGPFCASGPTSQLTTVNPGGTWSGTGVSPTGIFNPATAGPGSHNVTYSIGAAPCNSSFTTSVLVYANNSLTVTPSTSICGGGSTTLTASGAGSYTWSPATGLSATTGATVTASPTTTTTYTVTGTTNGCTSTATTTVTISPPLTISVPSATICAGTPATLTASGATNYTWSPATGLSATTGSSVTANPPSTTTYTITGTTGACSGTTTATVTVNPLPIINAPPITICSGGSGTLTASGATTYTWSPATGLSATTGNSVTASPATTTTYTVTGTSGSCSNSTTVTVTVGPLPVVSVAGASICAGSSATLTASGATTYTWSPATGLSATTGSTVTANPTTTTTYTITGSTGSCTNTTTATVTVNPQPVVNAGPDQAVCPGTAVTLNGTGGGTWDNGVTNGVPFTPTATTTYTLTNTANGCTGSDQVTVTVNPLPAISGGPDQSICAGQTVTLSGTGGVSYTWDNGVTNGVPFTPSANGTYTVTGTDANGCVNTDQVSITFTALPGVSAGSDQTVCTGNPVTLSGSGAATYTWDNGVTNGVPFTPTATTTYTVTGTTSNGCVNTDQVTVTVTALPTVSAGSDVTVCAGQTVTLSGSGASTYTWDNGVTNGVAFTPTATTTYTVTGSSGANCSNTDQVTVTVNPLPTIGAGPDQAVCTGASVTLSGTGGASYTWNNGVTNGTSFVPTATTTYTVTGTDANGCVNTDQVTVTVNPLPTVTAGADQSICAGGSVTLSGGGAVSYAWDNGVTNGVAFSPAATVTYTVTGTDANGCINTDQVTVTVVTNPVIGAGNDVSVCTGGSVTLTGTGPTGATYTWDNGITNGVAFTPTATTTYTVTGTVGSCTGTDQVTVTVNPLPIVGAGQDVAVCAGQSVTLTGTGASTYAWNNGVTNGTPFVPTATTTYTVTGTDVNGCVNTDQVVVTVNPLPVASAGTDVSICPGDAVTLTGTGANTYGWNNGISNGVPFNPTASGTYVVTGTDMNGCTDTDTVLVTVNPNPVVNAGPDVTVCQGNSTTLTGSGAVGYGWSNNVIDGVPFVPASTQTYTVTGTSAAGCTDTDQVTVTVSPTPVVTFQTSATTGCAPTTVTFTNTSGITTGCQWSFGDGSTGSGCSTVTHTFTGTGCYDITLITTSADGCIGQQTINDMVCLIPNPDAAFTADPGQLSLVDSYSHMINNSTGAVSYGWEFGDGGTSTETSPLHMFPNDVPGTYEVMLIAYNELGCRDTAYANVIIDEELLYYVPNTFTPDGDQFNQTFKPVFTTGFDPYDYSLYIYDRWGELIFESHNALYGWSGTYGVDNDIAQDGTYVWKIEFKTTKTDERKMIVGHVLLLR